MRPSDTDLIELAAELADAAGAVIRTIRAAGFEVVRKADQSPVTAADHAAEKLIVDGLRAAVPSIPVIAEEEVEAGLAPALAREYWLVDPLDGTKEFAAGHDSFCVNIGLVRDGRAVLGVVGLPAHHQLFGGIVGAGAWRADAAGRRPIAARRVPPEGLTVLASRSHVAGDRLSAYLEGRPVARIVQIGSAEKFCRVAEGAADLYPRFGRTMEWDTCAPQAVLEAAGGSVRDADGRPLGYGKRNIENGFFVAAGVDGPHEATVTRGTAPPREA